MSGKKENHLRFKVYREISSKISREKLPSLIDCQSWVRNLLSHVKTDLSVEHIFTVRFTDVDESANLNLCYRKKKGATNVLSFVYDDFKELKLPLVGDIVICVPVAKKEARSKNIPMRKYYAWLIVHGVLHVLGFTHDSFKNSNKMEDLEHDILQSLNL